MVREAEQVPTCAICTRPVHLMGQTWEHLGSGVYAQAPVRHRATPAPVDHEEQR
jgi:hypothetical protein